MRFATMCLVFSILTGCFPHDAKSRRTTKWIEGGAVAAGIAFLAASNTGADCFGGPGQRAERDHCRHSATLAGELGLGLIVAGLLGFGITTMMTGDEAPKAPLQPIAQKPVADDVDPDAPRPTLPGRTATRPNKH
jgi:hypothetical protein